RIRVSDWVNGSGSEVSDRRAQVSAARLAGSAAKNLQLSVGRDAIIGHAAHPFVAPSRGSVSASGSVLISVIPRGFPMLVRDVSRGRAVHRSHTTARGTAPARRRATCPARSALRLLLPLLPRVQLLAPLRRLAG